MSRKIIKQRKPQIPLRVLERLPEAARRLLSSERVPGKQRQDLAVPTRGLAGAALDWEQ